MLKRGPQNLINDTPRPDMKYVAIRFRLLYSTVNLKDMGKPSISKAQHNKTQLE